jgi:hypothetical protein
MAQNLEINETTESWARIVLQIFREQLTELGAIDTKSLIESLVHHVNYHAEGNPERIDFFYRWYGKMVDMGVGGNINLKNRDAMILTESTSRRERPWFSKNFNYQVEVLGQILSKKYAQKGTISIVKNMNDGADMHAKRWETL